MDIAKKIQIIGSVSLFQNLTKEQIEVIAQVSIEQILPPHTVFIEQESQSNVAYIICTGGARVYRITEQGEDVNIAVIGSGDVVGEMALLDNAPRSANVETLQNTQLLMLTQESFSKILKEHPEVAFSLLSTLSKRVRETNQHIEDILYKNLFDRTWKMIQTLAKYFPNNTITLSQEELAAIVGATRARITETLNELQKQGKITTSHRQIHVL